MGAGNTLIHNSQEITVIYKLQIGFVFFFVMCNHIEIAFNLSPL